MPLLELGTLGSGNHFIELQADEENRLWLMIHSGSRAIGPAIRDHHIAQAGGRPLAAIDSTTDAGRDYLADLAWARDYAQASRRRMADAVSGVLANLLGTDPVPDSLVDCDHNHVQAESHFGQSMLVHRKGAMAAGDGASGILPGSMGTASFHVRGRGCAGALGSSAHGAGRSLARDEARRKIRPADLRRQMSGIWFDPRLAGSLCEEAPAAYKDIHKVLRAQRDLVAVTRKLRPVMNYKGF